MVFFGILNCFLLSADRAALPPAALRSPSRPARHERPDDRARRRCASCRPVAPCRAREAVDQAGPQAARCAAPPPFAPVSACALQVPQTPHLSCAAERRHLRSTCLPAALHADAKFREDTVRTIAKATVRTIAVGCRRAPNLLGLKFYLLCAGAFR